MGDRAGADRARRRLAAVKVGEALMMDVIAAHTEPLTLLVGPDGPLTPGTTAMAAVIADSTVVRRVVIIDGAVALAVCMIEAGLSCEACSSPRSCPAGAFGVCWVPVST